MPELADPSTLLGAWERASAVAPAARGAALLPSSPDQPLGVIAARAAAAYVAAYGPEAVTTTRCTSCGDVLEISLDIGALASAAPPVDHAMVPTGDGPVQVRALTTADLLAVREAPDPVAALVRRCARDAMGAPVDAGRLRPEELAAVDQASQELAGVASVSLATVCPACGARLTEPVDVVLLLWEQVESHAIALLSEVAVLAGAFGWTEPEVLALSGARRAAYLALVG